MSQEGEELEHSEGEFKLLQPGYFSWHIHSPDEQLLLAAGNTLVHYDVELETATRRDISGTRGNSPLAILSGDGSKLSTHYQIEQTSADTYRLVPRSAQADFVALSLIFEGDTPVQMTVQDQLQQTTVIRFSEVELNPELSAAEFVFVPPPGVDLYFPES